MICLTVSDEVMAAISAGNILTYTYDSQLFDIIICFLLSPSSVFLIPDQITDIILTLTPPLSAYIIRTEISLPLMWRTKETKT